MSGAAVGGLFLYIGIAAAFAAFWHRIWRLGFVPSAVAAGCSAGSALAISYVMSGELTKFAVPIFAALFLVALAVGTIVQVATRRVRAKNPVDA